MDRPTKDCIVCQSKTTDNYCSEPCQQGQNALLDFEKSLRDHKFDKADTRIFFYDHSLSELFNLYTVELLKCFHSKTIKRQHYHWNKTNLFHKTIVTKINKDFVSQEVLREYAKFVEKLYKFNAAMWEARTQYHKALDTTNQSKAIQQYYDLAEFKETLLNEIDLYCGLDQYNEKIYG